MPVHLTHPDATKLTHHGIHDGLSRHASSISAFSMALAGTHEAI